MAKAIDHWGRILTVDDDLMGLVTEIRDRWPDLDVKYIDSDRFSEISEDPFIVVDDQGRKVLGFRIPGRHVIEQLSLRDKSKKDLMQLVTREEERLKKEREAAKQEIREERIDLATHVFSSPKGSYSFINDNGEKVTVHDS